MIRIYKHEISSKTVNGWLLVKQAIDNLEPYKIHLCIYHQKVVYDVFINCWPFLKRGKEYEHASTEGLRGPRVSEGCHKQTQVRDSADFTTARVVQLAKGRRHDARPS